MNQLLRTFLVALPCRRRHRPGALTFLSIRIGADNKIVAIKSSRYRRELITRTDEAVAARFLNESVDTQVAGGNPGIHVPR